MSQETEDEAAYRTRIEIELTRLTNQLGPLRADVHQMKGFGATVPMDVSRHQVELNTLNTLVRDHNVSLDMANREIGDLHEQFAKMNRGVADLQSALYEEIGEVRSELRESRGQKEAAEATATDLIDDLLTAEDDLQEALDILRDMRQMAERFDAPAWESLKSQTDKLLSRYPAAVPRR